MKLFTQAGWVAMQVVIFGGFIALWASAPGRDGGSLGAAILLGGFFAYALTFCTLMLVEFVALGRRKVGEWRQRRLTARQSAGRRPLPVATASRARRDLSP